MYVSLLDLSTGCARNLAADKLHRQEARQSGSPSRSTDLANCNIHPYLTRDFTHPLLLVPAIPPNHPPASTQPSPTMSTSATPPSATPSVPPQGLPFPLPTSATASILTNANTTTNSDTTKPTAPPLPPPQTFDILPPLHALLSRLEPSLNSYTTDPITTHTASHSTTVSFDTSTQPPSTQPTQSSSQPTASVQGGGNSLAPTTSHTQTELSYKEVVTATQPLKAKMRKALAELGKLGDMHRLPAEQEEEIRELEARIAGQRAVLGRLGGLAGVAAAEGGSP